MARRIALALLEAYQRYFRAALVSTCRFSPSCSEYAKQALITYGLRKGFCLAARRLLSCHPFSSRSGYDPVV